MNNEVAAFLAFLKDERQLSDNTLMSYQRDLEQTVTYLEDRGITNWQQVDHYLLIDLLIVFVSREKLIQQLTV